MLALQSLSRILGPVLIYFLVVSTPLAIDSYMTKDFFLSFQGYSQGHHIHANLNEISGVLRPVLSFFGEPNFGFYLQQNLSVVMR